MLQRRGRSGVDAGGRRVWKAAVGVIALAVVVAGALLVSGRATDTVAAPAAEVRMSRLEFRPGTFDVPQGREIAVKNADSFLHTFTVPALDIDRTVLPGIRANIEIDAQAGTYTVYCKPHADLDEPDPKQAGMAATLRVL